MSAIKLGDTSTIPLPSLAAPGLCTELSEPLKLALVQRSLQLLELLLKWEPLEPTLAHSCARIMTGAGPEPGMSVIGPALVGYMRCMTACRWAAWGVM